MALHTVVLDAEKATDPADLCLPGLPEGCPPLFRRKDRMALGAFTGEATTLGWDTAFAIRLPDVNNSILKARAWPKRFDMVVDQQEGYELHGDFGSWQLAQGGSGGIVMVATEISKGTMKADGKEYSLDSTVAYVAVKLLYVPQKPGQGPVAPSAALEVTNLMVNPEGRSPADPPAIVQDLIFPGLRPPAMVVALMIGGLQEWFNKNLVQFAYVFSTVNLNQIVDKQEFQWLQPTYTGYAYLDGLTEQNSYFGVLAMTEDRSPEGLANQLGPNAIPTGDRAGFSIGYERFLEKMVLPGLAKGFTHATTSSFTLAAGKRVIINTESIRLDDVSVNGSKYTPYLELYELQVIGTELQVHTRTKIGISPGIRVWVDCVTYQTIVVVDKPDKSQTLDFKESRPATRNHWIETDPGVSITVILIGIAGVVAGGVASAVIEKVAKIIIAIIIIAIVAGLLAATPQLIAEVAGGKAAQALPSIGLIVQNATSPIKWPDSTAFHLKSAGLNGAFQLGGDPGFA